MLKREINYTDYDGNPRTETHYFNLTVNEVQTLRPVDGSSNYSTTLERLESKQDVPGLAEEITRIILLAYGEKSEDGRIFRKSKELSDDFSQSAAFEQLYRELQDDARAANAFFMGILPKEAQNAITANSAIPTQAPPPFTQQN